MSKHLLNDIAEGLERKNSKLLLMDMLESYDNYDETYSLVLEIDKLLKMEGLE